MQTGKRPHTMFGHLKIQGCLGRSLLLKAQGLECIRWVSDLGLCFVVCASVWGEVNKNPALQTYLLAFSKMLFKKSYLQTSLVTLKQTWRCRVGSL